MNLRAGSHGIKNSVEYRQRYKDISDLPAHPQRIFKNEWISYSDFFDIPEFMPYDLLKKNEILLKANSQSDTCQHIQVKEQAVNDNINELDRQKYVVNLEQNTFDTSQRTSLAFKIQKLEFEHESAAKKMDMLLCNLQSAYKLIQQCQFVTDSQIESDDTILALIKKPDSEIQIEIDQTSYFQQLHENCENTTIYDGSNPSRAVTPRSQLLDRIASCYDLAPQLFMLTEEQQLSVGSQLVALLKARLKSWERVNDLIDGHLRLSYLMGLERIEPFKI